MKKMLFIVCMSALMVPLAGHATILFQDTFNRPDTTYAMSGTDVLPKPSNSLDATNSGFSGTLNPYPANNSNTWFETAGNSDAYIVTNTFSKRTGGEVHAGLNLDIQEGSLETIVGGAYNGKKHLRIQMDLVKLSSFANSAQADDFYDRFNGFGIGYNFATITNLTSMNGTDIPMPTRRSASRPGHEENGVQNNVAANGGLFVCFEPLIGSLNQGTNGNPHIGVYTNGYDCARIPWPAATNGTLTVDYAFNAIASNQTCQFVISQGGEAIYSGSYVMQNDQNYALIHGRAGDDYGNKVDDFIISTTNQPLPEPVKLVGLAASPSVVDNDKTANPVTLTYTGFNLDQATATYAITVPEGSAAFPSGGQTGNASNGAHTVAATVNGTVSSQTVFQIIVSESATPVATNTATVTYAEYPPDVTTVLFADTFSRANDNNLDALTTGMSGTLGLGAGVYLETLQVSNQFAVGYNEAACSIFTNLCLLGYSNATFDVQESGVGINHNFTDAAITTAGNFSMSARITADSGSNEGDNRFVALSAGCTLAEINDWTGIKDLANKHVRGNLETGSAQQGLIGTADFSVGMNRAGVLTVVTAGYLGRSLDIEGNNPTGNLRVDFGVTGFNKGSFVSYIVYWNDVAQMSGYFRWQNTGQNYVAFSGRSSSAIGARLDDLKIGTCGTYEGPATGTPPTEPVSIDTVVTPVVNSNGLLNSVKLKIDGATNVVYALRIRPSLIYDNWRISKDNTTGGEIVRGPSATVTNYSVTYNPISYGTTSNGTSSFAEIIPINWDVPVQ